MLNLDKLTEERIAQIEQERQETLSNQDFIKWFHQMRIASRLPKKPIMETDRHHFETDKINFQFKF